MLKRLLYSPASHKVVWLAILGGFWLRVLRLDFQPLWFDEGYSLYFANNDFLTTASLTAADIHPPLYYDLLHVWMIFSGPSDISVRMFSVFVGTLAIPLTYILAKRLFDRRVALFGALLLSFSPFHIYYAQEVRMYALITSFVLLSVWAFVSLAAIGTVPSALVKSKGTTFFWAVFVISESLALYTQYYAVFLPLAQAIFLFWKRRSALYLLRNWILAQLAVLVIYLPWLIYAGLQLTSYVGEKVAYENYAPLGLLDFAWRFLVALSEGTEHPDYWQWAAIPAVLVAIFGIAGHWLKGFSSAEAVSDGSPSRVSTGKDWDGILLCALVVIVTALAGWLVNQRLPFNPPRWERLYLFSLPFFVILAALGLIWLGSLRAGLGWICLAIILAASIPPLYAFYTVERYPDDDYRLLVKQASALGRPDDLVAVVYPWQVGFFESYFRGPLPKFAIMYGDGWNDAPTREARLLDFASAHQRIWVPAYQALGAVFENKVEQFMAGRFFPAINDWYGNTRLLLFSAGEEPPVTAKSANFEGTLTLKSYSVDPKPVEAGRGTVDVALAWQAQKPLHGKLLVKLRLFDAAGHTWAQRDSEPVAGLKPARDWILQDTVEDRHGLLVPAGTPPGEYTLGLIATMDGNGLGVIGSDGNPHGQELTLAKVQVQKAGFAPQLESVPVRTRVVRYMGDGIETVGYSMGNTPAKPGESILIDVFWRSRQASKMDHEAIFSLVDEKGQVVSELRKPVGQGYSPQQWTAGEVVRDQFELTIPATLANGTYGLRLSLGGEAAKIALQPVQVKGRDHVFSPPAVAHPATSHLGDSITLVGFDVGGKVASPSSNNLLGRMRASDTLNLKLVWKAEKEVGRNLKVFTQVLDPASHIWGQRDDFPGGGTMPTAGWVQSEYIADSYEIVLKPETPAGTYSIVIGLYDPLSGERVQAFGADGKPMGDHVVLGRIEVEP